MRVIKNRHLPPEVVDAKLELEKIAGRENELRSNVEKLGREIFSKENLLAELSQKISSSNDTVDSLQSTINQLAHNRTTLNNSCSQEVEKLESIRNLEKVAQVAVDKLKNDAERELLKVELNKQDILKEVSLIHETNNKEVKCFLLKKEKLAEELAAMEKEKQVLGKLIQEKTQSIEGTMQTINELYQACLDGKKKLQDINNNVHAHEGLLEKESFKLSEIQKQTLEAKKELDETLESLTSSKKELNDTKEQILKLLGRERRVEEKAKEIVKFAKRADIDIVI